MAQGGPVSILDKRSSDPEAHIVRDRITRSRSLDREGRYHSDIDIELRIPQCYRTSFSAVSAPVRSVRNRSRSKSPSSSCLKYRKDMSSESLGGRGRKGGKHVTYSDNVVVRGSDASGTLSLSDSGNDRSRLGGANVSDDYSSQLRELSQQIVQEYSANDTNMEARMNSEQIHSSKTNASEANGVVRPRLTNSLHVMNDHNSSRKRIVVEEDYDHDRSVSYNDAVNSSYSEEVKTAADELIAKATVSENLSPGETKERRNSLPPDIQIQEKDRNKLDPSKRSISSSISNFFRRMSPRSGRKYKKGSQSNMSAQSLSTSDSLDGSLHKHASSGSLSRGKLRRSFMKLIGKSPSKKDANRSESSEYVGKSPSKRDPNAKRSESSEPVGKSPLKADTNSKPDSSDCEEKDIGKESQSPGSALYMKSIEQSAKSDVYQMFKDKQRPGSKSETPKSSTKPTAIKASPLQASPDQRKVEDGRSIRQRWLEASSPGEMTGDKSAGDQFTANESTLLSPLSPDSERVGDGHVLADGKSETPNNTESRIQASTVTPVNSPQKRDEYKRRIEKSSPPMTVVDDFSEAFPFDTVTRTPSYLRISSAVSGYGHYSKYSAYRGIEKRSPYSSTLSLRSSRSDLTTPQSPVEMPIGKIPNISRPTNYPPLKSEVLSPRKEIFGDTGVETLTPVNGSNEGSLNGRDDSSGSLSKSEDVTIEGNGHIELVENFVSTGNPEKDADSFLSVTQAEENRLLGLCSNCEGEMCSSDVPEEGRGKIRAAVGKANLLISQKFQQFRDLCEQHKCPVEGAKPTKWEDLQGFWEMVKLQVDDVHDMFNEIEMLRNNAWIEITVPSRRSSSGSRSSPKSNSVNVSNASTPSHTPGSKRRAQRVKETPESSPERTQKAKMAAKERNDARKKLLAEKRAAMKQQQVQQQQDVEIFVPENGQVSEIPERVVEELQNGVNENNDNDTNGTEV
ncbi:uncharacterized protein LOC127860219 [Dreissena polymorpha]|uniref:Disks large-associated protein 1 n=1 Tax=Dreissena polymorpha TaxID=45954 RepID=A0A9D3YNK2_DREPO|nr:uncharacterized protein LOC127860219 [Dreissena polymorpha]XP_052254098.1 uncharacterized protein LOC127860219 [Dreissena polymorpha]KAH3703857.1 hypothetical protein DPMN_078904 [Dreissena polymorpha]